MKRKGLLLKVLFILAPLLLVSTASMAEDALTIGDVQKNLDFVWTLVAAFLVFLMQAGFALVESGFTRAKNAINIMMKNIMDFSIGSIAFWAVGFGLMFGVSGGWIGTSSFFLADFAAEGDPWLLRILDVPGGLCGDRSYYRIGGYGREDQVHRLSLLLRGHSAPSYTRSSGPGRGAASIRVPVG